MTGILTTVNKTRDGSKAHRTAIPPDIYEAAKIGPDMKLEWSFNYQENRIEIYLVGGAKGSPRRLSYLERSNMLVRG